MAPSPTSTRQEGTWQDDEVADLARSHNLLSDGSSRMLTMAARECDRLCCLVDELMALAMVEQRPMKPGAVSMQSLANTVVCDLRATSATEMATAVARAELIVADLPGAGFDMAQSDELFVVFQRLPKPLDYAGARVLDRATPGHGVQFYFALPLPLPPERQAVAS